MPLPSLDALQLTVFSRARFVERKDETGATWNVVLRIHPDKYRACDALVTKYRLAAPPLPGPPAHAWTHPLICDTLGRSEGATIEVMELSVHKEGDAAIEVEHARPGGGDATVELEAPASPPSLPQAGFRTEGFKSGTAPGMVFATVNAPF